MPKHLGHFTDTSHFTVKNKLWKGCQEVKEQIRFYFSFEGLQELDDVTAAGKLFYVRAVATGNARSPTVDSRVGGTSSAEVDDDRRRCRTVNLYSAQRH